MIIMDEYIVNYILHYSDIHDTEVSKMVCSQIVPSEKDANRLLSFIDILFKHSTQDMDEGKIVLGELADNYDAEKAGMAIMDILRDNDFGYLVDSWEGIKK